MAQIGDYLALWWTHSQLYLSPLLTHYPTAIQFIPTPSYLICLYNFRRRRPHSKKRRVHVSERVADSGSSFGASSLTIFSTRRHGQPCRICTHKHETPYLFQACMDTKIFYYDPLKSYSTIQDIQGQGKIKQ